VEVDYIMLLLLWMFLLTLDKCERMSSIKTDSTMSLHHERDSFAVSILRYFDVNEWTYKMERKVGGASQFHSFLSAPSIVFTIRQNKNLQGCAPHLQGWHHPSHNQKSSSSLAQLHGWKHLLPLHTGHGFALPLTPLFHRQPLSVTHQSLPTPGHTPPKPSPLPAPPAADTQLPLLPTGLPPPSPSTGQH
jgi:hypothetical protein